MLRLIRARRDQRPGTTRSRAVAPAALVLTILVVAAGCTDDSEPGTAASSEPGSTASSEPGTTADSSAGEPQDGSSATRRAQLNDSADPVVVVGGQDSTAGALSVEISQALFAAAPVVVVAEAGEQEGMQSGATQAAALGVPLLLIDAGDPDSRDPDSRDPDSGDSDSRDPDSGDSATASQGPEDSSPSTAPPAVDVEAQQEEIARLGAETVLAVSPEVARTLGELSDADVVSSADDIPDVAPADGLADLAVLVREDADEAVETAASASAEAAGAEVIPVAGQDLRSDPGAISALADHDPARVLAVGAEFGPIETLSRRVEVARTGVQLPGGGQALFPGRRLVALYGTPGTPGLGVLGEQDLEASIARAKETAADYDPFSGVPVVPAFEIIATVAQADAGPDGDYSGEIGVEELRPWVERAGEEGVYVVLDLQPGRANFLDQAKIYEDLLRMPHVGLALDPEWRLTPEQRPLGQIGRVEAEEVNSVITWLADLTAQERLPQKLLVLHQFQLAMLQDTDQIDLGRDEVEVLIHMDGQGAPNLKDETWQAVVGAAPDGVRFGWKNFYDEDQPMLTPEQTMDKEPTPFMISYQ